MGKMDEFGKRRLTIRLIERMLGTVPKDKDIYANYIAGKSPKPLSDKMIEEEVASVEEIEEKGWTGFHQDEKGLFIYDYLVKGFIKNALEVCIETAAIGKISAYKKWADLLVFVWPRKIYLGCTNPDGVIERPLRTMSPKGPRVALSRSDYIDVGRDITFEVEILPNKKALGWPTMNQVFAYGRFVGLGQWRGSGGYGRFELIDVVAIGEMDVENAAYGVGSVEQR